jgi:DMSO/TMAO reductase YedYZ molybdopterin-dependent catalytic subunit
MNRIGRREFLGTCAAVLAARHATGLQPPSPKGPGLSALAGPPAPGARLVGNVELGAAAGAPGAPYGMLLGSALDARLFTDLSTLAPDRLIVPNDKFFVRTAYPPTIDGSKPWVIQLGGPGVTSRPLGLDELKPLVRPFGACLIECAGNTNPSNFGLLSTAEWDGVPLAAILDRMQPPKGAARSLVLVSGVDDFSRPSQTSVPGASWIFSRDDLDRAGAFLATTMNGAALPKDHGLPVRLIVPGWYGCACIKWVDRIELVAASAPATAQMTEFAQRTHQNGRPALARDFAPAIIDLAAMPIRVEKWIANSRPLYRIVGVMWGGSKPTNALQIRFRPDEPFVPVSDCPMPKTPRTWSLWSHIWRPPSPRRYQIVLRVNDPAIRTRRLDVFFYVREVRIDEV